MIHADPNVYPLFHRSDGSPRWKNIVRCVTALMCVWQAING